MDSSGIMGQTLATVVVFVVLLAMLPFAVKWVQRRTGGGASATVSASRLVSALAVGQHQRILTVEVGPEGARTWLILGVTGQTITCLHTMPAGPQRATAVATSAMAPAMGMVEPAFHPDMQGQSRG